MARPLLTRGLTIAGVTVALLVPISLIEGKINERSARADSVVRQFAAETTGAQVVAGPLFALTCEETYAEERQVMHGGRADTVTETKSRACPTGYFTPRTLKVAGSMPVENRHRGIYRVRLYQASLELAGEIAWPAPASPNGPRARTWKRAFLVMAVSDPRGIKAVESARGTTLGPSADESVDRNFAIREDLGDYDSRRAGSSVPFAYKLQLAGTSDLGIVPLGDATEIRISSSWPHPSFIGAWSPDERRIDGDGFEAIWRTTHLATGGQPYWEKNAREGKLLLPAAAAGVSLFEPLNVYSLSYRATEYAFLFILFTFAALALAETLTTVTLHPMQYALVGSAIAVFFLLLIAMSEHVPFSIAYAAAATACVTLLTVYLRHSLGSATRSLAFLALFAALYGSLFVLLMSEDHALLLGSVMVFTLLAAVMVATRKLDWSAFQRAPAVPAAAAPVP
jgi:inner membrane protein